jgi:PHD/YefM family antitoxin component YafN of YafNO toxin-antitoxin module
MARPPDVTLCHDRRVTLPCLKTLATLKGVRDLKSDAARRGFRDLLDEIEHDPGAAVRILRYERPVAVLVSAGWYERAIAALTDAAERSR